MLPSSYLAYLSIVLIINDIVNNYLCGGKEEVQLGEILNASIYQQGNFFRIPKLLMQGEKYQRLSSDAKLLYALYQDRAELSIKNNWTDKNGDIYFFTSLQW